jgi:putative ubiquitin-RnfH superfamily antitoxin RatB of RatAB toxin-antitoxin module
MAEPKRHPDERDLADQDPVEVLRRLLAIRPKDAEKVREDAAKAMESGREGNDS